MKEKARVQQPKRLHDLKSKVKSQLVSNALAAMGDLAKLGGGAGSTRMHTFGEKSYSDQEVRESMRKIESALGVSVDGPLAIVQRVMELEERSHSVDVEKVLRTARLDKLQGETAAAQAHLTEIENMRVARCAAEQAARASHRTPFNASPCAHSCVVDAGSAATSTSCDAARGRWREYIIHNTSIHTRRMLSCA